MFKGHRVTYVIRYWCDLLGYGDVSYFFFYSCVDNNVCKKLPYIQFAKKIIFLGIFFLTKLYVYLYTCIRHRTNRIIYTRLKFRTMENGFRRVDIFFYFCFDYHGKTIIRYEIRQVDICNLSSKPHNSLKKYRNQNKYTNSNQVHIIYRFNSGYLNLNHSLIITLQ